MQADRSRPGCLHRSFQLHYPRMLLYCDPTISERFLYLPPSLHEGEAIKSGDSRLFIQPFNEYNLRTVIRFRGVAIEPAIKMQENREIPFIPFTDAYPPLEIGNFAGELFIRLDQQSSINPPSTRRSNPLPPHTETMNKLTRRSIHASFKRSMAASTRIRKASTRSTSRGGLDRRQ